MVIISIALAFAAPTLRGWGQGQKLRNATDQFIAATGYARSQAVTNASMYAVEINSSENTFAVKAVDAMGVRTASPGEPGRVTTLPEAFKITLISGGGVTAGGDAVTAAGGQVLLFYPGCPRDTGRHSDRIAHRRNRQDRKPEPGRAI